MVFLLNSIPILIVLIGVGLMGFYFFKRKDLKATAVTGIIAFLCMSIYQGIQPSYLPKGDVPSMTRVPITQSKDIEVQDRLLKPMDEAKRQERVEEIITVREEVNTILSK